MTPLGIVADEIDRDFASAVKLGKRLGILRYEIRFLKSGRAPMCDEQELRDVERIAREEGVQITALSPGLFKWAADEAEFTREMSEMYPRAAEWAHRWNLPGLIVFGFRKPGAVEETGPLISSDNPPQQIIEFLARAAERAAADNLLLMIEPEVICWADTAPATAALINRAGSPALRVNYDPGNLAWMTRRDPLPDFASLAPLIANVHIKDVRWRPDSGTRPDFCPAGEGIIDYAAHFAALRRIGYAGPISLEPHMDGHELTIERCKKAVEKSW